MADRGRSHRFTELRSCPEGRALRTLHRHHPQVSSVSSILGAANARSPRYFAAGRVFSIRQGLRRAAILMIAGIFSSFVFEKAKQEGQGITAVGPALRSIFNDFQFIAALFVSPLIFNSIYALTNQNPESMGDFLLAYQNGFFWQTVLAGIAGKVGANKRPARSSTPRRASKANS
jgi:hypothetical protein